MNLNDVTVGIVGAGTVGTAIGNAYRGHIKAVRVYDIDESKNVDGLHPTLSSDVVFVCLPTPQCQNSLSLDTKALHAFFSRSDVSPSTVNYVLKSTVPVGTTSRLRSEYGLKNLVYSPEFLTARTAAYDATHPEANIVGFDDVCPQAVIDLYRARFSNETPVVGMSTEEAELVKLALNSYFAVQIAFFNELRAFADSRKMRWDNVIEGMIYDGRVSTTHSDVPGPDGLYGFGGDCLPKDLQHLALEVTRAGLCGAMMNAAIFRNKRHDRPRELQIMEFTNKGAK